MRISIALLIALLQTPLAQSPERSKGSIEGIVLRAGTNEPVEEARVILIPPATSGPSSQGVLVTTDSGGKFTFKDLDAGSYTLAFECNGCVRQEFGQRTFPGNGSSIQLGPEQAKKDLVMRLTPTGSVSGRIRDRDGQPLVGVPVQLMKYRYDYEGHRSLRTFGTTQMRTNDRGEYRIYFVTPGRYLLNAGTSQGPSGYGSGPDLNVIPESYAYTYYPGVSDAALAATIDVQPGAELSGLDWVIEKQTRYRIRGRIIDSSSGQSPASAHVRLNYWDPSTGSAYDIEYLRGGKGTYENGIFEFRDVMPGSYAVSAEPVSERSPATPAASQLQFQGYIPVEVAAGDVDGIVLTVSPGSTITGHVSVDRPGGIPGITPDRVKINLVATESTTIPGIRSSAAGPVNPDGAFRIEHVVPSNYRIVSYVSGYYIKEARFGGIDVLNRPLQFDGSEARTLDIVVSGAMTALDGKVSGDKLDPVPAALVVLVPDQSSRRIELFKTASTDENGHFNMSNIPPGDYKLFSWEALEPYAYLDPDLLRQVEGKGVAIHLTESSHQRIDLKVIPSGQ
jgi:protocatechuate 3,4-dioxygenase beta subunit